MNDVQIFIYIENTMLANLMSEIKTKSRARRTTTTIIF